MSESHILRDRALGAFYGLALGDALGMPTQSFSREQIQHYYGKIEGLIASSEQQPLAPGMPAGSITDDTEQAVLVAKLFVKGHGHIDSMELAQSLMEWEQDMLKRGSLDLLGPSTRRAIDLIIDGATPEEAGRYGTTNGAAMRITPIGIGVDIRNKEHFLDRVINACQVTHNTSLGIAGASAIAAAVSSSLNGESLSSALEIGTEAAHLGQQQGHWIAGANIAERIKWSNRTFEMAHVTALPDIIYNVIGTSVASQESVVAVFMLAHSVNRGAQSPYEALCQAASLGGDTDTIAAMLGAILGASYGLGSWPPKALEQISKINDLELDTLVSDLLHLRHAKQQ